MSDSLIWSSSSFTHVGTVRSVNQDDYLEQPDSQGGGLWAVADGMGGHQAGEVASHAIVENLANITLADDLADTFKAIEAALHTTNQQLREEAVKQQIHNSIGSTVVVLLIHKAQAVCIWVGDSRIYRLRDNQLEQLTHDHSHVQELIDHGLINAEEAERHPMSNVVTRAVGVTDELVIDKITFPVQIDDVFMLCSDGLTKAVSQDTFKILLQAPSTNAAEALVNAALEKQADDNVTAIVVAANANYDTVELANPTPQSQPPEQPSSAQPSGLFERIKKWFS